MFFQLVSSRCQHVSLILTSNLPFARWRDVFGDQIVASAMIAVSSTTAKSSHSRVRATVANSR
ncbi:ATP-binding protein [Arthrobacter sp. UKPF54-2]|uniref:ATP-binding protein n=1 Tax=Arthrobacter sp. UKPF54-2 TaxID=2600159 RepID=UPI0021BD2F94|nr:ATP-binding protein [Arthrobacter sp. UKPF54-2]